jgi:hypothetical protein
MLGASPPITRHESHITAPLLRGRGVPTPRLLPRHHALRGDASSRTLCVLCLFTAEVPGRRPTRSVEDGPSPRGAGGRERNGIRGRAEARVRRRASASDHGSRVTRHAPPLAWAGCPHPASSPSSPRSAWGRIIPDALRPLPSCGGAQKRNDAERRRWAVPPRSRGTREKWDSRTSTTTRTRTMVGASPPITRHESRVTSPPLAWAGCPHPATPRPGKDAA